MMAMCIRYIPQVAEAEEALGDAYVKFFKALKDQFVYTGYGSLTAYLKKIVINECLVLLRKQKPDFINIDITDIVEENIETPLDKLSADEILITIQSLPPGYRSMFNLYVMEGMSHSEIADLLGISISTSKTQLMKAKQLLRKKLSNYGR